MDTLRLPKKEEQEETEVNHQPSSTFESINAFSQDQHNHSTDDFDGIFDITIDSLSCSRELAWGFWEEEDDDDEEEKRLSADQEGSSFGFWDNISTDYEEKELGLKLNLNHQEVIEAWSDCQQPLWTDTAMLMAPASALYVS